MPWVSGLPLARAKTWGASGPLARTTLKSGGSLSPVFRDRKSTRLNSSHLVISYAVFCLKKKKILTFTTNHITHSITPIVNQLTPHVLIYYVLTHLTYDTARSALPLIPCAYELTVSPE